MQFPIVRLPGMIAQGILGFIYPPGCQACGDKLELFSGNVLCSTCYNSIRFNTCPGNDSSDADTRYLDAFYSACIYEGALRECVHNFKYNGRRSVEKLFKYLMIHFAESHIDMSRFDWLIPVPLHTVKHRERTFNQSEALAVYLSKRFGVPVLNNNLVRARPGRPQITLPENKRSEEVRGSFRIKKAALIKNKAVLLIDDVFTTGATVNECSKVIKKAGAGSVEAFTLARSA